MSRPGSTPSFPANTASSIDNKRKFHAIDQIATSNSARRSPLPEERDTALLQHGAHKRQRTSADNSNADCEDGHRAAVENYEHMNGTVESVSSASTTSSLFSHPGHSTMSSSHATSAYSLTRTPPTAHESSPADPACSPRQSSAARDQKKADAPNVHHIAADKFSPGITSTGSNAAGSRRRVRPGPGEIKGHKIAYDPELDIKHKKLPREQRLSARWKAFGQNELSVAPPDPRLAIPGYRDGNFREVRSQSLSSKQKLRDRLIIQAPYSWDPATSVGAGPPPAVVVTGFDPLVTGDTQLRYTFGTFGDIATIENRTDPSTGSALGICWIKYRDNSRDGRLAADAAKRAEKEGPRLRVGTRTVNVERDRTGKKASRYVERASRKAEERRMKELEAEEAKRAAVTAARQTLAPSPSSVIAAPPPNAPKGPSGKSSIRPPEAPRAVAAKAAAQDLVEQEPVVGTIKRKPYVFIPDRSVPVMGTTIPHLKKRMKIYDWREVRCDKAGYYLVFDDSKRGEDEAAKCFKEMNGKPMFTYVLEMECQQYGNPNYVRSPSPERAALIKQQQEDEERRTQDAHADWEAEKKVRAENLDPGAAAAEQLRGELLDWILNDLKTKIAAPTFHDFLDPSHHVARREELGIAAPPERPQNQPLFIAGDVAAQSRSTARYNDPRRQAMAARGGKQGANAFVDERRQKASKRRPPTLSLHHKLLAGMQDEDSDEDEKASSRDEVKDNDSRSISRFSSVAPDSDSIARSRLRTVEAEDSVQGEESGEDDMVFARKFLDPNLLRKEPEDMAVAELQQVISTMPSKSNLHKHAQKELRIRRRNRDDDRLFSGIRAEDVAQSVEASVEDIGLMTPDEDSAPAKKKKESKSKKKSKKQMFQEREAAKAAALSAKALLKEEPTATPDVQGVESEPNKDEFEEEEEEERAEVEWGVSTDVPRRTVEDEPDLVMDIDGWQHVAKDDEDFRFLQDSTGSATPAKLGSPQTWAHNQKEIKRLNVDTDDPSTDSAIIRGYYVSNESGSARTEGIAKILESEKSKYLPHRLKVAAARARRQAEKANPPATVNAEAAKKAKLASTAMSRSNRANNRTHMKDINTVKQNLILDGQQGDAVRFNALKKRKKLVKFERSAIHGWGLYADENIALGDMIIEYVGEKVRQAVANIREIRYDKQGMGSSYLFRIDDDSVVDATKKGGIARFINHSCAPNCTAKIIKVEGTKRIVIYALKEITKDEELTYDYKFDRELDNNDRIPCLCGSEVCKGFLN